MVVTGTILKLAEAAIHRFFPTRDDRLSPVPKHALRVFWLTWLSYGVGAALSVAARGLGPIKIVLPLIVLIPVALGERRGN